MVADPTNNLVYWSGGDYDAMAVSKTTNGGITWTRYSLAASGYTFALAVDPSNSNIVYAGGVPELYRTTNGGNVWNSASTGITDTVFDIEIDPGNTNIIYAGTPDGVFKTTNSGGNWTNTGCSGVTSVVVSPDSSSVVYAGSETGVYKSTNGGGLWTAMNDGLDDVHVSSLGINPADYLYCGTEGAGMYRWDLNVGIIEDRVLKTEQAILSAQPNPSRGRTLVNYQIFNESMVRVSIYDVQGRKVRVLVNEVQNAGVYTKSWNGCDCKGTPVPGGVYFCRLTSNATTLIQKLVITR